MSIILDGTSGITTPDVSTDDGAVYAKGNILGTVSQSAGVPTGAIIERGSNANGEFVKYADGTQICTLNIAVTDQAVNTAYGSLFIGSRLWTFPVAFDNAPSVSCGLGQYSTAASWSGTNGAARSVDVTLRFWDAFSGASGANVPISAIAIGRWF
jgi:hypothetical protein